MLMLPSTNSDSEDDLDYVPPEDDHDSDSSPDEQDKVVTKHAPETDLAEQKKQRDELWASFQASVSAPSTRANVNGASSSSSATKRVKIEKTYLFAGKHVTEVVEVAEDSEDAQKWPRWSQQPRPPSEPPTSRSEKGDGEGESEDKNRGDPTLPAVDMNPSSSPATPTTTATVATAVASTSEVKRPGPRKPRTALPSISKASQAKKITTLDKCAMDWRAHVSQSSDVQDELDANRRGGGYLEKVDFLKRVEGRREDAFESSKASKRRKT